MKEKTEKTSQALKTALQMELDGKEFYRKSEQQCNNDLAKKLFLHLVKAEDLHILKIKEIYKVIESKAEWPERETTFKHEKGIKSIFRKAMDEMAGSSKITGSELEAIKTSMAMEDKSYSFYVARDNEATSPAEKGFYKAIAAEERGHYLLLLDSYEFLIEPNGWLLKNEHWGLDGA